jgi:hypothetical protein
MSIYKRLKQRRKKLMKTVILITILIGSAFNLKANAACIPPDVAESAVSGRTYILKNNPDLNHPIYLKFGDTRTLNASYGSALDGHPGGTYHFRGNCHGHIIVSFISELDPREEPVEVLYLKPTSLEYFELISMNDNETIFSIVTDQYAEGYQPMAYKRYRWIRSFEDPAKRVCWDDKAGIEVGDSWCETNI